MMNINIDIPDDVTDPSAYLASRLAAIGYTPTVIHAAFPVQKIVDDAAKAVADVEAEVAVEPAKTVARVAEAVAEVLAEKPRRGRKPKEEPAAEPTPVEQPQISTQPANRVGPEDPPEVQEQDAADEAAEVSTVKLTSDDVKNALVPYQARFGVVAALEDVPKLLALALPPETVAELRTGGKLLLSKLPDDQGLLARLVAGAKEMLEKNPFERKAV